VADTSDHSSDVGGRCGLAGVVLEVPVRDEDLGFGGLFKVQPLGSSSHRRPLNDSIQVFCRGAPGSLRVVSTPVERPHSATAAALNSGRCRSGQSWCASGELERATVDGDVELEVHRPQLGWDDRANRPGRSADTTVYPLFLAPY
jgi:hypothetical protein